MFAYFCWAKTLTGTCVLLWNSCMFWLHNSHSPLGILSKQPLNTLATVSATLPVVLSSKPSETTTEGGFRFEFHFFTITQHQPRFCTTTLFNLHSLLLLQLPRLPLTIRRMVSCDVGGWLSVAKATGLPADGGSRLPFWKRWEGVTTGRLDHLFWLWLSGHPQIPSSWLRRLKISASASVSETQICK